MIIPVKCFTCGTVLGNKYRFYLEEVIKRKMAQDQQTEKVVYLTKDTFDKTIEAQVMDELRLKKICCRRHMLTHVDIE